MCYRNSVLHIKGPSALADHQHSSPFREHFFHHFDVQNLLDTPTLGARNIHQSHRTFELRQNIQLLSAVVPATTMSNCLCSCPPTETAVGPCLAQIRQYFRPDCISTVFAVLTLILFLALQAYGLWRLASPNRARRDRRNSYDGYGYMTGPGYDRRWARRAGSKRGR